MVLKALNPRATLATLNANSATLGKLLDLSVLQAPHTENVDYKRMVLTGLLTGLNSLVFFMDLEQRLAQSNC